MKNSPILKSIPNALTVMRILLVIPFVWVLLNEQYQLALLLLFIAGASDGLDGFLARHYGWYSWFGSVADPIADKILLVVSYIVLGYMGHLPLWLVCLVVGRDILIFSGAFAYWKMVGHFEGKPTWLGKICTFTLIVYGLLVLVHLALFSVPQLLIDAGAWLVAGLCVFSGLHYVYLGIVKT
ncbi:MAG: CDP-alcohol phosphatidyltransferase family protein, partial [Pseudomonadales bacterium]|nr:CDP-alcohol phosphatidyltransferase family protein [Pseudomonadales bacterium]